MVCLVKIKEFPLKLRFGCVLQWAAQYIDWENRVSFEESEKIIQNRKFDFFVKKQDLKIPSVEI